MSTVISKPIFNYSKTQCWLNTFVQVFSNNDDLMRFIREINTDLSNNTTNKTSDNYTSLFPITDMLVTTIDEMRNPSNTEEIYTITSAKLEPIITILNRGGHTERTQDVSELFVVMNTHIINNEESLRTTRPTNPFHRFLESILFDMVECSVTINEANRLNDLQQRIDEQKLTIDKEYVYLFIYVNREVGGRITRTPLYTQKIIEVTNRTTTNKRSYILTGVVCHPPGHYVYASCYPNGDFQYVYNDDNKMDASLREFTDIREESFILVYKSTDKKPDKAKDKAEYDDILSGRYITDTDSTDSSNPYKLIIKYEKDIAKKLMGTGDKEKDKEKDDDEVFSPPLFYFTMNTMKTDDFDYLFYLTSENQFCEALVNNVPNRQYYDLFDMGETLKDKFKQSIEYTTEKFDQVYKKNEEKPVSNDVNIELTFYNKRDILSGKTKNNIEQKYNLFYYSYKLNE